MPENQFNGSKWQRKGVFICILIDKCEKTAWHLYIKKKWAGFLTAESRCINVMWPEKPKHESICSTHSKFLILKEKMHSQRESKRLRFPIELGKKHEIN